MKNHIKKAMHKIGNYLVRKSGINDNKHKYDQVKEECYECLIRGAKDAKWIMPYNGLGCPYHSPKTVKICSAQGKYIEEANQHTCHVDIFTYERTGKVTLDRVMHAHVNNNHNKLEQVSLQ